MASEPIRITEPIRFGNDFELDLRAYELRRSGKPLKLERIPMELLVLLVERRGELVTRDQIIERVWGKDVFLDTDNSINAAIRKIRQALKDDPERPRFVLTVTGKGYRFVAAIDETSPPQPVSFATPESKVPAAEDLLGKKVSHYRVLHMLGGGGMGVVYKAEDLKLGRAVALKFLPSELATDPVAFERLQREARAASSLDHPNICSIYQLGEHEGQPFIVMQMLEGQTLREWIESTAGKTTAERVNDLTEIAIQIADGLEAAHQKGIIHRDIKPTNIFITGRGQAKILDFGVAKLIDAADLAESASPDVASPAAIPAFNPHLTRTGASVGTPSYLSPEQIRRDQLDARTDIFSFGLVLYEMATGQRAFSGETVTVIREAVLNSPVTPIRRLSPELPPALQRVIEKCVEKERERRYQTAAELRADLINLRDSRPGRSLRRPWKLVTAAAVFLITLGLLLANVGRVRDRLVHRESSTISPAGLKPRPSLAVLGFKNLSGKDDEAWISTAISEMLGAELAAGQQVRIVPEEDVARMTVDFSLLPAESYGRETLARIRAHLNADTVVVGSYLALGKSADGKVRVDVQLQDTKSGETIAVMSQEGTETGLADLISRSGVVLRQKLGIGDLSAGEERQVRATVPANLDAARLYSDGLARLEKYDALSARQLLEKAIAADPSHALSHSALAEAWSALGFNAKARAEAKQALDLSANLSRENRLLVEGRYHLYNHDYPAAVEIYRTLRNFFPDDLDYALRLASAQTLAGLPKDAFETVNRMRALPAPQSEDARIDLAEADAADDEGDLKHLQQAAASCARKAQAQGSRFILGKAREKEAWAWRYLGDLDKASELLKEARDIFASAGNPNASGIVVYGMAGVLQDKGDYVGARKLYEESLLLFRQVGSEANAAIAYGGIGNIFYEQGKFEEAKHYYEETLRVNREVGNQPGIAAQLGNLANVLEEMGDLVGAEQSLQQSLQVYRPLGHKRGEALVLGQLAGLMLDRGELDSAQRNCEQSIALSNQIAFKMGRIGCLLTMADIRVARDQLAEARAKAQEAISLSQEIQDQANVARSQLELAEVVFEEGKLSETEAALHTSGAFFDQQQMNDNASLCASLLARVLLAESKVEEARVASDRARTLSQKAGDRLSHFEAALVSASVDSQAGRTADAIRSLEAVRAEAASSGYLGFDFEARLHLGEIELRSGRAAAGRARLQQLQTDARSKGFLLIARRAADTLNGKA